VSACAVISPAGELVCYPLQATAEVEALVSGEYAPARRQRAGPQRAAERPPHSPEDACGRTANAGDPRLPVHAHSPLVCGTLACLLAGPIAPGARSKDWRPAWPEPDRRWNRSAEGGPAGPRWNSDRPVPGRLEKHEDCPFHGIATKSLSWPTDHKGLSPGVC
jgi:hypothetical protein